ncbi:MAG: molybdopterin-dependent oxidoreductase [Chloroflexota bacterium]
MTNATLDRVLAVLVVAAVVSGAVALRAGAPSESWLYVTHGVFAGSLAIAVIEKLRRSLPRAIAARRLLRLTVSGVVTFIAAGAIAAGITWAASGELVWVGVAGIGRWTWLTVHAWAGLLLIPVIAVHLVPRRWRLLRPSDRPAARISSGGIPRRSVLVGALFLAGGGLVVGVSALAERLQGATRRFTGSRWLPAGSDPPVTTFYGEGTAPADPAEWRLRVTGPGAVRSFDLAELLSLGMEERRVVLDCTSGWAVEANWRGVPLSSVLSNAGLDQGRRIEVRSVSGWASRLDPGDVGRALLAVEVNGRRLPPGNGAPCRLVVADRRGLDWVKWVGEIRVA